MLRLCTTWYTMVRVVVQPTRIHDLLQAISTTMQQTSGEAKAQRISGCFLPGHLSGIIGPAHSGKTAFCGAAACYAPVPV